MGKYPKPTYYWEIENNTLCRCNDFEVIQVPGKSTLVDFAKWLAPEAMEEVHEQLRRAVADEDQARIIGLESELDLSVAWLDST